jgi:hypothetical protein
MWRDLLYEHIFVSVSLLLWSVEWIGAAGICSSWDYSNARTRCPQTSVSLAARLSILTSTHLVSAIIYTKSKVKGHDYHSYTLFVNGCFRDFTDSAFKDWGADSSFILTFRCDYWLVDDFKEATRGESGTGVTDLGINYFFAFFSCLLWFSSFGTGLNYGFSIWKLCSVLASSGIMANYSCLADGALGFKTGCLGGLGYLTLFAFICSLSPPGTTSCLPRIVLS